MNKIPPHLLLALLCLAVGAAGLQAQQQPTGSWAYKAEGFTTRGAAAATDGSYLYIIAGIQVDPNSNLDTQRRLRRYDPVGDSWTTLAALPVDVDSHSAAFHGGRLFSFGDATTGAIYAYTLSSDSWAAMSATLTANRSQTAAATIGDRIYITGGYLFNTMYDLCDEYDPANDTITARAPMPGVTAFHCMAVHAGKAYVFGGIDWVAGLPDQNGVPLNVSYVFTPPTASDPDGSWEERAPIAVNGVPLPRSMQPVAFTLNDRIYVAGGHTGNAIEGDPVNTTLEYRPLTDTWTQRGSLGNAHYHGSGAIINGKAYVFGGWGGQDVTEAFTPPNFGLPPSAPTDLAQAGALPESALQATADPSDLAGWTNGSMTFSAQVTDPTAGQMVRLRIRLKLAGSSSWTDFDSGLQPQGTVHVTCDIPASGGYDWEWRVEDSYGNSNPADYDALGPAFANANSPDLRSDQDPPSVPAGLSPDGSDLPPGETVEFTWLASADDSAAVATTYEFQVSQDPAFGDLEAGLSTDVPSAAALLAPTRETRFWRVRSLDFVGNASAWSPTRTFRVVDLGGGGGGSGGCMQSAAAAPSTTSLVFILILTAALLARRR